MLLLSARAQTAQPGTQPGARPVSQATLSGLQGLATTLAVRDTFAHLRASLVVGGCREGYPPGLAEDVKANMTHLARMQHILFLQSLLHQLPQLIPQVSLYARPFAGAVVGGEACRDLASWWHAVHGPRSVCGRLGCLSCDVALGMQCLLSGTARMMSVWQELACDCRCPRSCSKARPSGSSC